MALPNGAHAQQDRYAPIVLQIPAGTRAAGLGGAFAGVRDIESVFANPALVGTATGSVASLERFHASSAGSLAAAMTLGPIGAAVSAQFLDFTVPVFTDFLGTFTDGPPVSSRVLSEQTGAAASSLAGALALATAFKGYRWGVAVKYVEERIGTVRDGSPALDLGVAKERGRIVTGLSVQNIGPPIDFGAQSTELPLRATLGMAGFGLPVGPFDFGLSLVLSVLRDGDVFPAVGTEWAYSPLDGYNFVVRAGVRRPELRELRPVTLGVAASLDRFALEYAFDDVRGGAGHRVGLRVR